MKKYIPGGKKDENGIYQKIEAAPQAIQETEGNGDDGNISIDDLLKKGLLAIKRAMKSVLAEVSAGSPSRETIQNLKDLMAMLKELKKEEKDILDNLSDEELEKLLTKSK